jgi:rhodanese-related sulfurtransferase
MSIKLIIDVREAEEFAENHAPDALNIPLSQLVEGTADLSSIPTSASVIVYCRSGNRSETAKRILESKGYPDVTNGINARVVQILLQSK